MKISSGIQTFSYSRRSEPAFKPGSNHGESPVSSPRFSSGSKPEGLFKELFSLPRTLYNGLSGIVSRNALTKNDKLMMDTMQSFEKFLKGGGPLNIRRDDKQFPDGGKGTSFSVMNNEPNTYYLVTQLIQGNGYKFYQIFRASDDKPDTMSSLDLEIPIKGSPNAQIMVIEKDAGNNLKPVAYSSNSSNVIKAFNDFFQKLLSELEKQCPPNP